MTNASLNVGIAYLAGAALAVAALYLAEKRWGARRIIPGALATLGAVVLWVGIDAPARADITPCASTRNGWTYDHCAGTVTPGPDAWVKPGSHDPFTVTLWRRDTHGGPQTRAARVTVADLSGFPADLGSPGEDWCGLQWDVTREGVWLAGVQTQWACPTPSTTTTTPTGTETSWTSPSPSTTSSGSGPTSSTPSTTTAPSSTSTTTHPTPTSSRPSTTESEPPTHGGTPTSVRHQTSAGSTSSAPTQPQQPAEALPNTGEDWQVYAALAALLALTVGTILALIGRGERSGRGRRQ